jgi:hypothetical protein
MCPAPNTTDDQAATLPSVRPRAQGRDADPAERALFAPVDEPRRDEEPEHVTGSRLAGGGQEGCEPQMREAEGGRLGRDGPTRSHSAGERSSTPATAELRETRTPPTPAATRSNGIESAHVLAPAHVQLQARPLLGQRATPRSAHQSRDSLVGSGVLP